MTTKRISEYLKEAKELINTPEKWTKGDFARDSLGYNSSVTNKNSVCFCAWGAISKVTDECASYIAEDPALTYFDSVVGNTPAFNDDPDTTHADVMEAFDKAIKLAEKDEENVR